MEQSSVNLDIEDPSLNYVSKLQGDGNLLTYDNSHRFHPSTSLEEWSRRDIQFWKLLPWGRL